MAAYKTAKLTAVNDMLSWAGEAKVASLAANTDAVNAEDVLDRKLTKFQVEPWYFNVEKAVEYTPDGSGFIIPGATVIELIDDPEVVNDRRFVIKDDRLYDLVAGTDVFTGPISLDTRYLRDWDDLPEIARQWLTLAAAMEYQLKFHGSQSVHEQLRAEAALAELKFRSYDARIGRAYNREANALPARHLSRRLWGLRRPV